MYLGLAEDVTARECPAPVTVPDGVYEYEGGKRYRVNLNPGDILHVDANGKLQSGKPARTVLVRAK